MYANSMIVAGGNTAKLLRGPWTRLNLRISSSTLLSFLRDRRFRRLPNTTIAMGIKWKWHKKIKLKKKPLSKREKESSNSCNHRALVLVLFLFPSQCNPQALRTVCSCDDFNVNVACLWMVLSLNFLRMFL